MRQSYSVMNFPISVFNRAAQRSNPRLPESHPLTPSIRGDAFAALPSLSRLHPTLPHSGQPALVSAEHYQRNQTIAGWRSVATILLVLGLLLITRPVTAAVKETGAIGITVSDLDRSVSFYTTVLAFEKTSESRTAKGAADTLLGLHQTELRSAELKLGAERITLTEHIGTKGRSIPLDSRSFDHWFQHIAIVVSDMDKAYDHLRLAKVKQTSTSPQTLPKWNKEAGGIKAFYFRDPDDHPLEIIWFPEGKGDPKWLPGRREPGSLSPLFLGIDHTALVVSDTDKSLAFYRDLLGLRVAGRAENYGVEQEHLNQVFGARLRITALKAERGPGIELLEYITPPGGRPLPEDAQANDLLFWHTRLTVQELRNLAIRLRDHTTPFISKSIPTDEQSFMVRDPDGHALQFIPATGSPAND